jgi:hypothetical protein
MNTNTYPQRLQSLIGHYQQLLGLPETWKVSDVKAVVVRHPDRDPS